MAQDDDEKKRIELEKRARERMDTTLRLFVGGMSVPAIVSYLQREEKITIARDQPYQDIARATAQRLLRYEPPDEKKLSDRIRDKYGQSGNLRDVFIPSFGERMSTMAAGARLCAATIRKIAQAKVEGRAFPENGERWPFPVRLPREDGTLRETTYADLNEEEAKSDGLDPEPIRVEIRIGCSGGYTLSVTAEELRLALSEQVEEWEKALKKLIFETMIERGEKELVPTGLTKRRFKVEMSFVLVNIVSGFDRTPRTNPIAFLTAYLDDGVLAPRTTVDIFNAMPFMKIGGDKEVRDLAPLSDIRRDYDKHGFDVILTSGSSIEDRHGMFGRYYKDQRLRANLEKSGVEGDILWMPVTLKEPFNLSKHKKDLERAHSKLAGLLSYRPMTLLDLDDIAEHVRPKSDRDHGRDVFFILAPCSRCLLDKSRIAHAVLRQEKPLVTHLVMDRETARATLEIED